MSGSNIIAGGAGTGGAAGAAAGSTGARAGTGGSRSVAGAPAPLPPATPVTCGGATCMAPAGSRLMSCCLADGSCGLGTGGECQAANQPGMLDPRCPAHEVMTAGLTLEGCCKPNDVCGVMSLSGLGCVDRTQLGTFAGGPLEARSCSEGQVGDAGVDVEEDGDGGTVTEPPDTSEGEPAPEPMPPPGQAGAEEDAGTGPERCVPSRWWARGWPWLSRNGLQPCRPWRLR